MTDKKQTDPPVDGSRSNYIHMKLYSFLLWLCCLLVAFVQPLTAQTTIDFEGVKFDPIIGFGVGYGKAFGVVESDDDEDELTLAGGFVFAITTTHSLTTIVSASGEGYQGSNALFDNNFNVGGVTQWSIIKSDDTNFQFKGIFLKDAGSGGSTNGTVTAYKGGVKIGNSVEVDFDGTLNQSFVGNPDFYDIDEVRIEAPDLNIYLDQFMAGPPYSTNANAPAQVSSIVVDGSPNSSATTMNFLVTFDKPVKNVSVDDFSLTGIGAMGVVGDITPVSTTVYRVSIASISGEGTLKLHLNSGTDIATMTGNIVGTLPFTAGETHAVGPCSIENFDQGESDNAASFSNNGQTYQLSGNWKVRKFSPVRGINGSGFHLSGTGQDPMAWKVSTNGFKVGSFYLFLSDDASGNTLATNGTVTITGKRAGTPVFTQMKSTGFNTDPSVNNGYTFIDLGSYASAVIDELEIKLGGSFQYVDLDNISLCPIFNAVPTISNLDGDAVTYMEGGTAVLIDAGSNATVTDSDSPNFSGGNMKVAITANRVSDEDVLSIRDQGTGAGQIGVSGSHVTYGGVVIGTWAGGTGTNDLVISFNVNSGPASARALIRNLTYSNSNTTDPATAARTIAVTLNDGDGGTSTPAIVTVQITAVNDAPTLIATAVNPTFTEGGAAVSLFSGTAISTIEAGQAISKLVFTVANVSDGNQEILTIDGSDVPLVSGTQATGTNGLTVGVLVSGGATTVEIGKSGGVSPAIMLGIVNGLTYRNISTDLNTTNRVITLSSIQDNGGTANGGTDVTSLSIASTITIVSVNVAPIVTTSGGNTTYTEGTAVVVDDALIVSDPDNRTLASATVAITGNFQFGQDVLEFTNNGTTMGNITAALYNSATGLLTLSSAGATANLAQWQAALRAVKYSNSSQNPSTANRTISFKVHDSGQESVAATKTVSVIAVNDAPVAVDDYVTLTEDIPATGNVLTNDSDPEGNALMASLVITPVNGTVVLNADGSFTYTPNANYAGRDSLRYQVCDNGVPSKCGTAWLHLTVNPVNDAPVVTVPLSIAVTEDTPSPLTGISFSDVDAGTNSVTVVFSVPSGMLSATSGTGVTAGGTASVLTLNGRISDINTFVAAGAITFTTASNATSNVTLTVSINDNGHTGGTALSDTKTIALVVTAVNDAPINFVPGAQSVDQDATLVFSAANNNQIFVSDVDAGANAVQLTLTATNGLITLFGTSGLSVSIGSGTNDASMTLTGPIVAINNALNGLIFKPTPGYNGPASLQITTDDLGNTGSGGSQTATNTIAITVNPINPKVVSVGASRADGTYKIGDEIALVVTFDQQVVVNSMGDAPRLLLETGAVDREAIYMNGTGTNTLTFSYTVQEGDTAPDLDYQSTTALSLNGATIKNAFGDDAVLTLPTVGGPKSIAGQHAIAIDGVRPTVASVAVPANGYYLLNQNLDFTVNFSEAVLVNKTGGTPGLSLTIGGQAVYANYLSGSGSTALEFRYVVINGLEDHDGITVSALSLNGGAIKDAAGNDANLTLNSVGSTTGVKVDAKPPAVPANFTAIGQNGQISLLWEANTEVDLAKYILYVKGEDGSTFYVAEILKGTENFGYTGLPNGKTFEFFLVAVDQVGNRSAEAQASAKTMGEQTISFATLGNLTYGQQTVVLTASATSQLPVSFVSSDSDIAEVYQDNNDGGKWKVDAKKVGTVTITAAQAGNNEYLPAVSVNQLLTIVPASLTVTTDAKTKVYGDADPALTYTVKASDLRNGDDASVVSGTLTRAVGESVGSYDITNVDLAADNYTVNYEQSTLSITKANLTVTADAKTKVYGDADPALTYTVKASDLRNGDDASVVSGTLTRAVGESVGSYDITNVDLAADNYTVNYEQSTLSITKANLTVTADAKTKVYGDADPALTYTVKASDLRNGDDASVVTGSITRVAGEDVGDYDINNVNLLARNYNIQYEKAKFLITKASIAGVTFADASFTYDGAVKSLVIAGTLPVGTQVSFENNEQTEAGEYTVTAIIDGGNNYENGSQTAKLTIEKATLPMFTFADASFVYDGTVKSLVIAGALPVGTQVSCQNNEQTEAGEYTVTAVIDGGNNYENGSQTAKLTIMKAVLPAFIFADASFVYDGTVKSLIITNLPAGLTATYSNNDHIDAGEYMVTVKVDGGKNYTGASTKTAKLRISPLQQVLS
ncbi:MBG domain-containing protein, partial [Sphingobacterium sp. UT-1RO-CII-1]|uniref:beta strand repeat-containing protein n=1 Tax=Sphingobacterium sp. UT-1RO-CII-1 TaxID=2995225 RepID=UPI00227CF949